MKLSKKVIALLLVVSIVLSIIIPISLTNAAPAGNGMTATVFRVPEYVGDCLVYDDRDDRFSYDNNKQFDATHEKMIAASKIIEGPVATGEIKSRDDDYTITQWIGTMTAKEAGTYTLIGRKIDNGFVMFVDGVKVYEYWGASHWFDHDEDRLLSDLGSFTVTAEKEYEVEIYFLEIDGGCSLEIYATTTPDDLNSGENINNVFDFELEKTTYKTVHNDTDYFNDVVVGKGTGGDGVTGNGGNGGQCITDNFKFSASIDKLLSHMLDKDTKVVSSFNEALVIEECYLIKYEGYLVPKTSGSYTFGGTKVDNGFYLKIGNQVAYEFWAGRTWNDNGSGNTYTPTTPITLNANQAYKFEAYFLETDGGQVVEINASNASIDGAAAKAVEDLFAFYPVNAEGLNFNLAGVNLLSGADTIDSTSELTIQYTNATLGDGIEMYATIVDTKGTETEEDDTEIVSGQQVTTTGWLKPISTPIYGGNDEIGVDAGKTINKDVYSNTAGAITFKPSISGTYSVSGLQITVWTENKTTGASSNKATTKINNSFREKDNFTEISGNNWMNYIDGATLLSQINIPGSHDTASVFFDDLSPSNKCQNDLPAEQLTNGVRYFDIRCATDDYHDQGDVVTTGSIWNGDRKTYQVGGGYWNTSATTSENQTVTDFGITHANYTAYDDSSYKDPFTFLDFYETAKSFLKNNPSETIIFVLNDESCKVTIGEDNPSDELKAKDGREAIMKAIRTFITADPDLFYTKTNEVPTLDDVRGKIVLFRRFPKSFGMGDSAGMDFYWIDGPEESADDTPYPHAVVADSDTSKAVTTYFVQDEYKLNMSNKKTAVDKLLTRATASNKASEYYINFYSSAYTFNTPSGNSETMNPYFTSTPIYQGTRYGWLIFDFITDTICQRVYQSNIFTTEPQLAIENGQIKDKNDKVVVHYDFENVSNNKVEDTEKNGYDGSLVNTERLTVDSIYNTVKFANNGDNKKISAGHITVPQGVFRGTGDTATVQIWMKNTDDGASAIFALGTSDVNYHTSVTVWAEKYTRWATKAQKLNGEELLTGFDERNQIKNQWHLVTYVIDEGKTTIYLDNTLLTTGTTEASFSDVDGGTFVNTPFRLGGTGLFDDMGFIGSMGDFTIYNYAVTQNEVSAKYTELAQEYTYITNATLKNADDHVLNMARAANKPTESYILESYEQTGSIINFVVPAGQDISTTKLSLQCDASKVQISENGDGNWEEFNDSKVYDLTSGNTVLRLTSIEKGSTYTKDYNVKINGIIVKDFYTEEVIDVLDGDTTNLPTREVENYLYAGWYSEANNANTEIETVDDLKVVFLRMIAAEAPVIVPNDSKSIRIEDPNGLRFKASINRGEFYNYLLGEGHEYNYAADKGKIEFGMLIIPSNLIPANKELDFNTTYAKDVEGEKIYHQFNDAGDLEYTGVIIKIPEAQYGREMTARAYIKFTDSTGARQTLYSDAISVGSYLDVAKYIYTTTDEYDTELKDIFGNLIG